MLQMHFAQPKCILRFLTFWFAEHFLLENVRKNAFDAKMHFCNASNAFDAKMHFGKHNKMLASNAFVTFCWSNIFQRKMLSKTKCTHLCFLQSKKHSIFASNAFLQSNTFCEAKNYSSCFLFQDWKKFIPRKINKDKNNTTVPITVACM